MPQCLPRRAEGAVKALLAVFAALQLMLEQNQLSCLPKSFRQLAVPLPWMTRPKSAAAWISVLKIGVQIS